MHRCPTYVGHVNIPPTWCVRASYDTTFAVMINQFGEREREREREKGVGDGQLEFALSNKVTFVNKTK